MEFAYHLGEHRSVKLPILDQSLRYGKATSKSRRTTIKGDYINHVVVVEEVMPNDRLRVSAILEVNSINAIWNGAGEKKKVTDRLF